MKFSTTFSAEKDVHDYLEAQKKRGMKIGFIINEAIREYKKKGEKK